MGGMRPWLTVVLCGLLSGCVAWAAHGLSMRAPKRVRIAVLPVRDATGIKDLRDIESVTTRADGHAEPERVKERMAAVTAGITRALAVQLAESPYIEVIPPVEVERALTGFSPPLSTAPSTAQAARLGAVLNAQALLDVELAGYGKVKRSWLTFLIGTGMVEAVVQGWVVARAASTAAGTAVALEEAAQELLTWGGGAYVIQRHFLPVILRGRLLSTADGKVLWSDTAIKTLDRKGLQSLPAGKRHDRAAQLQRTTQRAVKELTADFCKKAAKELGAGYNGESPTVPEPEDVAGN